MGGLRFGVSKEGSRCHLRMKTRPAKGWFGRQPPLSRRTVIAPVPVRSNRVLRHLSFIRSLIGVSWLNGRSNGVKNGAAASMPSKTAGCHGATPRLRRLSKFGIYGGNQQSPNRQPPPWRLRAPSGIESLDRAPAYTPEGIARITDSPLAHRAPERPAAERFRCCAWSRNP